LGANLLSLVDAIGGGIEWSLFPKYIVGVLAAMVSGYLSLRFLKRLAEKKGLGAFSYYCWGAGLVTLINGLFANTLPIVATVIKFMVDTCLFFISYGIQREWVFAQDK